MKNAVATSIIAYAILIGGCSGSTPPSGGPDTAGSSATAPVLPTKDGTSKNADLGQAAAIDSVFKQMEKFLLAGYEESKKDDFAAGQNYSANLESIDLRSCPADFQQAFLRYKLAIIEFGDYVAKRQGVGGKIRVIAEGAGAALKGESPRTLTAEPDRLQGNIRKAQFELESIAIRYGVQMGFHK